MQLETKYAEKIITLLEDAQDVGLAHVVFELRPQDMELQPHQLSFFEKLGEALDYLDNAAGNNYLPGDGEFADIDHLIPAQTDHRFRGKLTT